MSRRVIFAPDARTDLVKIYTYIADRSGADRAFSFVGRIELFCRGLKTFPERGTRRDDVVPGLRVVGFERRVAIAFRVDKETVAIERVLYGGRNLATVAEP